MSTEIALRGKVISQDEHGFLCLNDMWQISGENGSKSPSYWRKLPTVKELTQVLHLNRRFSPIGEKIPAKSPSYAKRG